MSDSIYSASCDNVKKLKSEAKQLNIALNKAIRNNRHQDIKMITPLMALLYSTYAEVAFFKMVHTPHGFEDSYIEQILSQRNLEDKWKKCLEFAFERIHDENKGEVANKQKELNNILNEYILKPSQIRNKIAHGQWAKALNNKGTSINKELTDEIENLDCVHIYNLFEIYDKFAECVEDLIESPKRAHYRYYYPKMEDLKACIEKSKGQSLETRKTYLQLSPKNKMVQKRV